MKIRMIQLQANASEQLTRIFAGDCDVKVRRFLLDFFTQQSGLSFILVIKIQIYMFERILTSNIANLPG